MQKVPWILGWLGIEVWNLLRWYYYKASNKVNVLSRVTLFMSLGSIDKIISNF